MTKALMIAQITGGHYNTESYLYPGKKCILFDKSHCLLTIGRKIKMSFPDEKDVFIILYDIASLTYQIIHIGSNYSNTFGGQSQISEYKRTGKTHGEFSLDTSISYSSRTHFNKIERLL